jgi:ankyrin repeat protein
VESRVGTQAPSAREEMRAGGASASQAARLRAAAAAGRVSDMTTLLMNGVPVDAVDEDGETALMKSVRANQPAAVTLLRRYGASLDRENLAGRSARDMALTVDDPELNRALGIGP